MFACTYIPAATILFFFCFHLLRLYLWKGALFLKTYDTRFDLLG